MKNASLSLAFAAVLGLMASAVAFADLAPKPGPRPSPKVTGFSGKIAKAADEKGAIEVTPNSKAREGEKVENVKVATDDKTVVTIDGKEAKVADLKEGMSVVITPSGGTATKIVACTKITDGNPKAG